MKKFIFAMAALGLLTACSDDSDNSGIREIQLTPDESGIVEGQQRFAFELFDEIKGNTDNDKNTLMSPLSAHYAMSMLANLMGGQSQSDVCEYMHISPTQISGLNALNHRLISELPKVDSKVKIKFANSLWAAQSATFSDDFITIIRNYYDGETFNVDFTADGGDKLNQWISKNTDGMISNMNILKATELALADCIKFDGKWALPFNEKNTATKAFKNGAGVNQFVPTMSSGRMRCTQAEGFIAAKLWYGNKAFSMTLLLPEDEDTPLSDISLTFDKWSKIKQSLDKQSFDARIYIPKFKVETACDLLNFIKAMKDTEAFSNTPDLNGTISYEPLALKYIYHNTAIEVSESSTTAASSTVGGFISTDPGSPMEIEFNRPFFYVIDEASTGAILFIGALNKI